MSKSLPIVGFILVIFTLASCIPISEPPAPIPEPTPEPTIVLVSPAAPDTDPPAPTQPPQADCRVNQQVVALRQGVDLDQRRLGPLTCYDIMLTLLDGSDNLYTGSALIAFTNPLGEPLSDLVFRTYANASVIFGGNLRITSAVIDGFEVEFESVLQDGSAYRLSLPLALQPGESVTVSLHFEGELPLNFGAGQTYGIFNLSQQEPIISLAGWYPILAELDSTGWVINPVLPVGDVIVSETALYRVSIEVPEDWQIAATGSLISSIPYNHRTIHEFVSGPARDFMVIASPVIQPEVVQHGSIRLVHWQLPGISYDETTLTVAARALDLFEDLFGPYPYSELDIVDMPLQNASGVEFPGLIILATNLYQEPDRLGFLPTVIVHEVAHQWWYAVVGSNVNLNPWQDEGLATFSTLLYHEQNDPNHYRGMIEFYRQRVAEYEQAYGTQAIGQPVSAFVDKGSAYAIIVYYKGALFFVDLREQIGDEIFFSALASYFSSARFRIASPDLLLNAFERACRCDLSGYYRAYGVIEP